MPFDYKGAYEAELAQREHLRNAVATPIGLLTLIGTGLAFMVQKVRLDDDWTTWSFCVLGAGSLVALVCATYFLVRAMHGHDYKQVETAQKYREILAELREWHTKYGNGPLVADRLFDQALSENYAAAADHNGTVNQVRSEYLFLTTRRIIVSGVLAGLALVPFGVNVQTKDEQPQTLVVSCTDGCIVLPTKGAIMANDNTVKAPPPPPQLPLPLRTIREGVIPKLPKR